MKQDQRKELLLVKALDQDQRININEEVLKSIEVRVNDIQRTCRTSKEKRKWQKTQK